VAPAASACIFPHPPVPSSLLAFSTRVRHIPHAENRLAIALGWKGLQGLHLLAVPMNLMGQRSPGGSKGRHRHGCRRRSLVSTAPVSPTCVEGAVRFAASCADSRIHHQQHLIGLAAARIRHISSIIPESICRRPAGSPAPRRSLRRGPCHTKPRRSPRFPPPFRLEYLPRRSAPRVAQLIDSRWRVHGRRPTIRHGGPCFPEVADELGGGRWSCPPPAGRPSVITVGAARPLAKGALALPSTFHQSLVHQLDELLIGTHRAPPRRPHRPLAHVFG